MPRDRRKFEPTQVPTEVDIAWAAGFLEGEGTFGRNRTYARVKANQVNREPLERLQALFGGSICLDGGPARNTSTRKADGSFSHRQVIWYWSVFNAKAENVMLLIYPLLSNERRAAVDKALNPEGGTQ